MCLKIALFGGTFDPVHIGHISMADYLHNELGFGRIIIMPNGNPPHKIHNTTADIYHRMKMLSLAFADRDYVEISDYEASRSDVSYSVDTLRVLRQKYGEALHFVIGGDSLHDITKWYKWRELLSENKFVIFRRNTSDFDADIRRFSAISKDMIAADMDEINISSTQIRKFIQCGKDISSVVGHEVAQYIGQNRLYGDIK